MKKLTIIFMMHIVLSLGGCYLTLRWFDKSTDDVLHILSSFILSFLLGWLLAYVLHKPYFQKLKNIFRLFAFFNLEFIKANLRLTYTIISVRMPLDPAVVSIPLDVQSDKGIMLLANLITLTPGTLSLDVSKDRKYLYLHTLYLEGGSIEDFKRTIKEGFEKRIIAVVS